MTKLTKPVFGQPIVDPIGRIDPRWQGWFDRSQLLLSTMEQSGVTADRPTKNLFVNRQFFDTTLGKPIWYDGTNWVDATGSTV